MRQNKYLIKEAKQNTNTVDNEAISDELCIRLMNRCQDFIMAHLYNKNIKTKIFRETMEFTTNFNQDEYDLPVDVYATNSINNISVVNGYQNQRTFFPIKQISEKDRGVKSGYFVTRTKIVLSPVPNSNQTLLVSYTKKMAELGITYGTVQSLTGTTITLAVGYKSMTDVSDFFSVVDSLGNIIVKNLPVSQIGAVLTVPSTTGVLVGMIVVPGAVATTHCQLPDAMESTLIFMLEKLINARLSSTDLPVQSTLTKDQLDELAEMYSDNSGDSFMPPIVEYTEWA